MKLKVKKVSDIQGTIKAPSSKSYSHRAIILASLANGTSNIHDLLLAEDTISSINACKSLGAKITQKNSYLEIIGSSKIHNYSNEYIDLGNSGTSLRILTSVAALSDNEVVLTGDDSLKTRPMKTLIEGIKPLGVKIKSLNINDKVPIAISPGYEGGKTQIEGNISSQFISSILISAPLSKKGVELEVVGEFISKPYVDMTIDIMEKFGVNVLKDNNTFKIKPQNYISSDYVVEGDYSSASYLLATVAILGGKIKINNLFKDSNQGDKVILEILKKMGSKIIVNENNVIIESDGNLNGIDVDLSNAPDLLITVAILGSLAEGKTIITGVKHGRFKETDRIATTSQELKKLQCNVEELEDGLIIEGGIQSGTVNSHKDHRLAMAFSLLGLKHNVTVLDGEAFNVSFPSFIENMKEIGVELELS
ncbi:MAG: 3-phosphoshikimate 1-carboxyvinyltransferase [Methanobacteriaceae archaeon]|jgi:3-phosphoshikimate 1-carboxyvinyltransferase|nr:3-phosphoshikimate 1-carboxyvinyltransferase [Methanobacteriaceae archaeon]